MATDYWASSHYKRWIVDRATLKQARADDLQYVDDPELLDFLAIYFANVISKLGKKLQLRQRVIATATVFFRRFYLKNSYCETDPFIVISACCYLAAKAEEFPVHIKNVVTESRTLFKDNYNVKHFPSDNTKLAEMEFYLMDDLECDLTVFHPYRTLLSLCKKEISDNNSLFGSEEGEADEVGVVNGDDGPRYWGTGEGQLELTDGALQTAWFILNDTYRSELCLLYPPHIIAIAALYLTLILHRPTRDIILTQLPSENGERPHQSTQPPEQTAPTPQPRRSSRQAHHASTPAEPPKKPQDPINFLAELNVSLPLIATVSQEIISLYTLWDRYKEDDAPKTSREQAQSPLTGSASASSAKRSTAGSRSASVNAGNSSAATPMDVAEDSTEPGWSEGSYVTPAMLSVLLQRMREARLADISHSATGRPVAINKVLERTQAAG